ncbi:hypothetical protein JAAARDRAFT_157823 [Jaapia argillacea MUCL 33604]|uniref:Uncharacterized protein n=1 Tax=Jaapia argillacea MUCL 33604 TaxID=933084 RepID=A0A067PPE5_9AGAM|nr:hypothetical protein JAAARDRAFT_157823 [Jaapia argillacea MUCL 33604]
MNMQSPSLLSDSEPLEALCRHHNVGKISLKVKPAESMPATVDLPVLRQRGRVPTHALLVHDTLPTNPDFQCTVVPVASFTFTQKFRRDVLGANSSIQTPPSPPHHQGGPMCITIPAIPLFVPHAPSIPLLLLYAQGLHPEPPSLGPYLLPLEAIEEFPSVATMAQVMAHICTDDQLKRYVSSNQGLWKNILALDPVDPKFVQLVQTAWNVTAEARRIRYRAGGRS